MFTKKREQSQIHKMDSETDFFSDCDYNEFANEILFVGDILHLFQSESVFTAAEIKSLKT